MFIIFDSRLKGFSGFGFPYALVLFHLFRLPAPYNIIRVYLTRRFIIRKSRFVIDGVNTSYPYNFDATRRRD